MISFAGLCRDLFLIAQLPLGIGGSGREWGCFLQGYLAKHGVRSDVLPGGYSLQGHTSLSDLGHQLDGTVDSQETVVAGEWKAYRGGFPKNELTDDFYVGLGEDLPMRPIDSRRWPAPVLASDHLAWSSIHSPEPEEDGRQRLAWPSRPLQRVLIWRQNGSDQFPRSPTSAIVDGALNRHDFWSDRLWTSIDSTPGRFEALIGRYPLGEAVAS